MKTNGAKIAVAARTKGSPKIAKIIVPPSLSSLSGEQRCSYKAPDRYDKFPMRIKGTRNSWIVRRSSHKKMLSGTYINPEQPKMEPGLK